MTPAVGSIDLDAARSWVRSRLPTAGRLEHVQTEPWATVYRANVGAEVVWFKACEPHQAFEVPMTAALSDRSAVVTDVIAHDAERRWLLMADAGEPLRTLANPPERWLRLLPAYAELQLTETAHANEHLAVGVPDLRLGRLPGLYDELVRADLPLEDVERSALEAFRGTFSTLCRELDAAGIAPTVQHDDLHTNNVYVDGDALRVLDWGDASIAHPFFSLYETFRFLVELNGLDPGDPWFGTLRDAYLEPWGPDHRGTFDLALRVGGVAHAIAWLHQRDALPEADRRAFDDGFGHILRLALGGLREVGEPYPLPR